MTYEETNVFLDLSTTAQSGWSKATVNGGNVEYWYKFTGGDTSDNDGGVAESAARNHIDIKIQFVESCNNLYRMKRAEWKGEVPPRNELMINPNDELMHKTNQIVIMDYGTVNHKHYAYSVVVNPKSDDTLEILCDPPIDNEWN